MLSLEALLASHHEQLVDDHDLTVLVDQPAPTGWEYSPLRWCVAHHGLVDVDRWDCDGPARDGTGCVTRPLTYKP